VIAISVFAVGVGASCASFPTEGCPHADERLWCTACFSRPLFAELPKAYLRKHWKSVAFLLGPVMVFGWFISAALIYGIIPGLSFLSALVIAACVTPTDPVRLHPCACCV
jgi:hypothetical protein